MNQRFTQVTTLTTQVTIITLNTIVYQDQAIFSLLLNHKFKHNYCMIYTWKSIHYLEHDYYKYKDITSNFEDIQNKTNSEIICNYYNLRIHYVLMAASSSIVVNLSDQLAKKCYVTQKNTKNFSLKGKGKAVESVALIGCICREDLLVTRGALNYALKAIWGTDHNIVIINTSRRNVFIFRIQNREFYLIILRGRPHSIQGHLMVLMPWEFNMNVHQVIFQFEILCIEFR